MLDPWITAIIFIVMLFIPAWGPVALGLVIGLGQSAINFIDAISYRIKHGPTPPQLPARKDD